MPSCQYRKSHCGDKTILRPSYLHNGISYTGKLTSFILNRGPGDWINIKMSSYQYRKSHVQDKMVSTTVLSLTWESPYLGKTVFILNRGPGGCFTNVLRALQNNLAKIYNARNNTYAENFKLKLCTCAQSMALGTRTKFQLEILIIRSTILVIYKFRENILESSRNVSETPPWSLLFIRKNFNDRCHLSVEKWQKNANRILCFLK